MFHLFLVKTQTKESTLTVAPPKDYSLDELEADILKSTTEGIEAYSLAIRVLKG